VHPSPPLRDVGCFARVAQRLSFSRAAAELGMSQPAVSQAIARLERALGLRLFERTSRDVQLTDAGKVLLPQAEALLDQAAAFAAEAERLATPTGRAIRLTYCPLVGTLAARVARRLARRSPGVDLELRTGGWSAATADLTRGTAAAAIMTTPFPPGLASTARFHIPVTHVAVPAGSPLATATAVGLDQAAAAGLLLPRGAATGSMWAALAGRLTTPGLPPDSGRLTADSAALRPLASGFLRLPADDLDDLPAALDLVAAGRGILPAPRLLVETVRRPDIRFLPLRAAGLRMTYGLVWRQESASAELMALVQAVQEILRAPLAGSVSRGRLEAGGEGEGCR
jgi:DNA-binding transcriptional LysR family regulator